MSTAPSSRDAAGAGTDEVRMPTGVHRRRGGVLLALAAFQFWLWGTRIYNLFADDTTEHNVGFVVVHVLLYTAAIGAGAVLLVLGARMWREARAVRP